MVTGDEVGEEVGADLAEEIVATAVGVAGVEAVRGEDTGEAAVGGNENLMRRERTGHVEGDCSTSRNI